MKKVLFRIARHHSKLLLTWKSFHLELASYSKLCCDSNRFVGMLDIHMGFSDELVS